MKFKDTVLSLANRKLKLTKGLQTTLFLNGLGFWNLQPKYAFMYGGADAFCRAWAAFMGADFNGDCEKFYKNFDFDIVEKSEELSKLIVGLVNRDIEPVEEAGSADKGKKACPAGKKKRRF